MNHTRFYDQLANELDRGNARDAALVMLGKLFGQFHHQDQWPSLVKELRSHPVHQRLLEDPFSARSFHRPRGYAGDAPMIDLIYRREAPTETTTVGHELFSITTAFQATEGVRQRRDYAETELIKAHQAGKRTLSLACGHFREGTSLVGHDLTNVTVVDQDPLSLDVIRADHGNSVNIIEANVIRFLRSAASRGDQWDYIYTLGLTDYFDDRVMGLFHQLLKPCLAPGGHIMLANFVPDHLAVGWMDAVMDWHLIYRTEEVLERHAHAVGLTPRTWRDATDSIAYCEMTNRQ